MAAVSGEDKSNDNWQNNGVFKNTNIANLNKTFFKYDENLGFDFSSSGLNLYFKFNPKMKNGLSLNIKKNFNRQNNRYTINQYRPSSFLRMQKNDISYISYKNSWVLLQIGHGNEDWGAGEGISLALSDYSKPYDYFLLASNYGIIRVRYIHGFLEKTLEGYNRFITGRGIEIFKKNRQIGFSEIVIYSGINRGFDLGYANPISTHLEIEINDRMNFPAFVNASNAVWQFHFHQVFRNKMKVSFNLLLDEFIFDPDLDIKNKDNGDAFSFQVSTPLPHFSNFFITSTFIYVGTKTFRHGLGTNNFVNSGYPLGWQNGSDGYELNLGLSFKSKRICSKLIYGIFATGEESIVNRSFEQYKDYLKTPFPSGDVLHLNFADFYFSCQMNSDIHLTFGGCLAFITKKSKTFVNNFFEISFLI